LYMCALVFELGLSIHVHVLVLELLWKVIFI